MENDYAGGMHGCDGQKTILIKNMDRDGRKMDDASRKSIGSFYTDPDIVRFMLKAVFDEVDVVDAPYIRILDPSCGSGYFLSAAYDMLKEKYAQNIELVNNRFPGIKLCPDNTHEHIIKNNLFGADIDPHAGEMCRDCLSQKKKHSNVVSNIICCDSLIDYENTFLKNADFWRRKFDIIIGNPPYIGHKMLDSEYKKMLHGIYGNIFRDKSDISFCFFKSSIDRLTDDGKLCFISSRYFMESPSGTALRDYIVQKCTIEKIIDFYGVRIMKGISVDPVIIFIKKCKPSGEELLSVIKAKPSLKGIGNREVFDEILKNDDRHFFYFKVHQAQLSSDGWVLLSSQKMEILKMIEEHCSLKLSQVCTSFQGIITGCDRAFVVDEGTAKELNIERGLLRRWIKNSNVKKYNVVGGANYLIYSDLIDDMEKYKNAVSHIAIYKDRLQKRRECQKGIRMWYQLQWGRKRELFEMRKIVFPYKSSSNRFAIDEGSFCSADVYGMYIDDIYRDKISYEFLCGLLNSKLYEFYFKSFAKKLGEDLYDYYPNTVMRLLIPSVQDKFIAENVKTLLKCRDEGQKLKIIMDIDNRIYAMFGLSGEQAKIVEGGIDL